MTYLEKEKIADSYLMNICGFGWDDLPDINSLHDANTKDEIFELCDDRINAIME